MARVTNFRTLIIIHLFFIILFSVFLIFSAGSIFMVFKIAVAALTFSLLVQCIIWFTRKSLFDDKVQKYPHET